MSAQVAQPVAFWPLHCSAFHGKRSLLRNHTALKSFPQSPTWRSGKAIKVMSDADTESSATNCSEKKYRLFSVTSSESEGGPHIVVHTTSNDEDEEDDDVLQLNSEHYFSAIHLLSVTSTDVGSDYTSEGGDSSHEINVQSVTPQLKAALVKTLEEYLSDEGLANDLFLLKHVKRHREGYVSLKLLSGYKKIKKLSRDWRVLSLAVRESAKLQANKEGTKVRRTSPLPSALLYDAPASRALVAVNVAPSHATMEGLATLFGSFGSVASLQVIRPKPGGGVPSELQGLLGRLPEIASTISAIVEYEDIWGAAKALKDLKAPPMTLHVLRRTRRNERPSPNTIRSSPTPTPTPRGRPSGKFENGVPPEELRSRLRINNSRSRHRHQQNGESSPSDGEDEGANTRMSWRNTPRNLTPLPQQRPYYRKPVGASMSTPNSPMTPRRTLQKPQQQQPFVALRAPKGPDGTKGFSKH